MVVAVHNAVWFGSPVRLGDNGRKWIVVVGCLHTGMVQGIALFRIIMGQEDVVGLIQGFKLAAQVVLNMQVFAVVLIAESLLVFNTDGLIGFQPAFACH